MNHAARLPIKCDECGGETFTCRLCGKAARSWEGGGWHWMEDMNGKVILARLPYKTPSPIETQTLSLIQKVRGLLARRRPPEA